MWISTQIIMFISAVYCFSLKLFVLNKLKSECYFTEWCNVHRVSKKLCKLIFCQNFVKFTPIVKIFSMKIAESVNKLFWGLLITRDSRYAIARICHAKSVRLSVCPSVTRVYFIKTAERISEILSPSESPIILVFRQQGSLRKSDGFTPSGGAKYKGGSKN